MDTATGKRCVLFGTKILIRVDRRSLVVFSFGDSLSRCAYNGMISWSLFHKSATLQFADQLGAILFQFGSYGCAFEAELPNGEQDMVK